MPHLQSLVHLCLSRYLKQLAGHSVFGNDPLLERFLTETKVSCFLLMNDEKINGQKIRTYVDQILESVYGV